MPLCESTGFQTGGARMGHTPRPHASPSPAMCSGERFIMSLSCCVLSLDCIQDHLRPSWGRLISSRKGTCIYKTHTHIHNSNRGEKQLDKSETSCRTQELRNCFFIFFVPRFYVAPMEKSLNYLSQWKPVLATTWREMSCHIRPLTMQVLGTASTEPHLLWIWEELGHWIGGFPPTLCSSDGLERFVGFLDATGRRREGWLWGKSPGKYSKSHIVWPWGFSVARSKCQTLTRHKVSRSTRSLTATGHHQPLTVNEHTCCCTSKILPDM